MSQHFLPRLLLAISVSSFALSLSGCATKEEREAKRRWETDEQRADREVFRSNWLLPSVSREEKDFFYRGFLRKSDF